ncbi:MAG: chloramphenicol acetyltransferase [Bacteroidota bacterium]
MKIIQFSHPHRQKHFEFFSQMDQPHLNICAQVEIGTLLDYIRAKRLRFTPSIVYLVSRAANSIPELRQRIRGQQVVEHKAVHPSFTVHTNAEEVFSFCEVQYVEAYTVFAKAALEKMEEMKNQPSFEDEEGRDDYLFLSAIPWINFTSIQHPMHCTPVDSVPRIAWGKFRAADEQTWMPLAVQAHHALVDGIHIGRFFTKMQEMLDQPAAYLR